MKTRLFLLGLLVAACAWAGDAPAAKADPKAAFEKLKTLAGDWTGSGQQGMATPVSYKVSANGNVVMETLFPGTPHEMITMYYLAEGDLVATHYCAGGNQPHFKLDREKSTPSDLVFAFDGGTNLDPAKDGHVHDGRIAFTADGQLDNAWSFYMGGEKKGDNTFHLTRKK